ncbi:ankyrin repeat domain-containing protein [Legionella feeleii]|uniref:Uncharacterized protein n=1 Tax=Legionella feeleii TaxID=453 RepID=A0A378IQ51_9GAMM|nr:ankyrin repeat domain-containing protein [Legionella feeleii]STX37348.1 Uncharacterised protein [Legionella feeleii]
MRREKRPAFFSPAAKQPTVILTNYIHFDGIGDFNHLLDIMEAFMPFATQLGIKVVPLVLCLREKRQTVVNNIKERCPGLQPFIFTVNARYPPDLIPLFEEFVGSSNKLQKMLNRALSIFQISTALTKEQKDFLLKFCQPNIPIVNISEQAGLRTTAMFSVMSRVGERDRPVSDLKNINDRWMGLENKPYCYGVKIKAPLVMTKAEAILALENTDFMRVLLGHSDPQSTPSEETVTAFLRSNQLIPAYLQSQDSIMKFIYFCLQQPSLAGSSDLTFYINNYNNFFHPRCKMEFTQELEASHVRLSTTRVLENEIMVPIFEAIFINHPHFKHLKDLGIASIEINSNGSSRTIVLDSEDSTSNKRTIRILTDFNLNDHDYDYLFHIASSVVGFSGDNTLEKALSHDKLPVLQSEEKYTFERGMQALGQLAKNYLPEISPAVQEDFEKFFTRRNMRLDDPSKWPELLSIDLTSLLEQWQRVTAELRVKNNLYTNLDHIFYEALLHMSAAKGDITLLDLIYEQFPKIDLNIPNKLGKTVQTIAAESGHENYLQELSRLVDVQNTTAMEIEKKVVL